MSVLAAKRKESRYEALNNALKIRDMFILLTQRNFGIKDINRIVRLKYAFGKEDSENFEKYRYLLNNSKSNVDMTTKLLINNLASAYSLYPTSNKELEHRREILNDSIGNCNQLIFEIQDVVNKFDVDVNDYDSYQKVIYQEIGLIKKWRQRDNKLKSHFTDNF